MKAKQVFQRGLDFVLRWEGGYVNDPADAGGETKYGISKRAFPQLDIANLTKEQAGEIYQSIYWDRVGFGLDTVAEDYARPRFAICIFDTAVNMGVGRAQKLAQKAANAIPDGKWGPLTRKAFMERSDALLVEMLLFYRRQAYRDIVASKPSQEKFLKGWLNRVKSLQEYVRNF